MKTKNKTKNKRKTKRKIIIKRYKFFDPRSVHITTKKKDARHTLWMAFSNDKGNASAVTPPYKHRLYAKKY
jgi:hypothetical protein